MDPSKEKRMNFAICFCFALEVLFLYTIEIVYIEINPPQAKVSLLSFLSDIKMI